MAKPTVLLIAGGANSRFFPFQSLGPKGTFSLLGKSLLARTLESLHQHAFTKIVCVITPKDAEQQITQQIVQSTQLPLEVQYVVQSEPKGMGDAVLLGITAVAPTELARFAVCANYHIKAGELLDQMLTKGENIVLAVAQTPTPNEYGMLAFNEAGLATNIIEKPALGTEPSTQKALSIYLLAEQFIEQLKNTPISEYNFESALAAVIQQQPAAVLQLETEPLSLKYPWQLLRFLANLLKEQTSFRATTAQVASTAVIDESQGSVYIGEGAQIGHASRVVGPCYIGENVIVGDFSLIRQSSLEKEVHVGGYMEVTRSLIGTGTHFHSGYIGDSLVGPNVRVGAGFITANKRIDRKTIGVKVKDGVVDSGLKQLGVLIGEAARVGVHVSVMPGKCIGPGAVVMPHQSVTENIVSETTIS